MIWSLGPDGFNPEPETSTNRVAAGPRTRVNAAWSTYSVWENDGGNIFAPSYDNGHLWMAFR